MPNKPRQSAYIATLPAPSRVLLFIRAASIAAARDRTLEAAHAIGFVRRDAPLPRGTKVKRHRPERVANQRREDLRARYEYEGKP